MQATIAEQYGMLSHFLPKNREKNAVIAAVPFRVLIMESSVPLARLLATGLEADGLSVEVAHDLISYGNKLERMRAELLIVDLDMPGIDGFDLLRSLRLHRPHMRLLALSSQAGVEGMVSALDNGADDYLNKPFSLLELMARVRALRRSAHPAQQTMPQKPTSLTLHHDQCRVERDGRFIELTPREFALLEFLMQNPGKTLSRALLTEKVWNMTAEGSTNIVDVYIKYLRDKLDADHDFKLIRTIRGIGYSYQAQI